MLFRSILGFNIGIELMQLFVMSLIVPWLILLSQGAFYTPVRLAGATFAAVIAVAWMVERVLGQPNIITVFASKITGYAAVMIVGLAVAAVGSFWFEKNKKSA